MSLNDAIIDASVARYIREYDRYAKLVDWVWHECEDLIRGAGILASVQHRAKAPSSFRGKLERYRDAADREKANRMDSVDSVFNEIGDLAAVRVTTYVEADRDRVVQLIRKRFRGLPALNHEVEVDRKDEFRSGYRATHCQVLLPTARCDGPEAENIRETSCEIQVCSMLAHVWNEIEHDIRYKNRQLPTPSQLEVSLLDELGRQTAAGNGTIESILRERSKLVARILEPPVTALFETVPHFRIGCERTLQECVRMGYDTPQRLADGLLTAEIRERGPELAAQINTAIEAAGENVRLNPETADALLAILLFKHADDLAALHEHDGGDDEYAFVRTAATVVARAGLFAESA